MIKQTWDVSNEEKNRILNLHETATKNLYIIKEQIQSSNIIDFGSVFPSGQYQLSSNFSNEVSKKVQDLVGFIKGKNLKDVTIDIQSGASKVTNQAPFQEPGSLALARANSLKTYLDRALPNLLGFTPKVVVQNPIMGTTPYTPGDNKDDPRYTKEQFVRAVINTLAVQDWQRKSSVGEPIYLNNRVIAIIEKPFVDSKSTGQSGTLDLGRQNVIFKVVKPDTQPPQVVKEYNVPWGWWNEKVGPSSTINQDIYNKIINQNFS